MKKLKGFIALIALLASTALLQAQYNVGDKVSDFKLKNIDGKEISLSSFEDAEGLIIVFTCNTCPVAKKYEERIIQLDKKFSSKGYPVVAINPNSIQKKPGDSMEAMKERAKDKGYGFVYLKDDDQKVAKEFGAERTPEIYLLEKKKGNFHVAYTGTIDNNVEDASKADKHYVEDAVNSLMSNESITLAQTVAVGCTIKW